MQRRDILRLIVFLAATIITTTIDAQPPHADWRTIRSPHFRVHHPKEFEAWSTRLAARLESIRVAVGAEVGYTPPDVVDVVVVNPVARANGIAWPFLDAPRTILYTEPPGPDDLGEFGSWLDTLAVHEYAHLAHMLRPSRNRFDRRLYDLLGFGPVTMRAPRWVLEGYATVIEGRLTGAGRPSSTMRAAILRKWARSGRLPTYAQMNSDSQFLGMSMAYLMGSAYLEWLESKRGPESLRHVWVRLSAVQRRKFDEAFEGVFGESPRRMYGRFVAELTDRAMTIAAVEDSREGVLWQETSRNSGDPAVSPDGKRLAMVMRRREAPARLVVFDTGAPSEEEKRFAERLKKMRQRDPEDVPPIREKPLPRKPQRFFVARDGGDLDSPRWMPDGKSILFGHRLPDHDGVRHRELMRWWPESGDAQRITKRGDVSEADPLIDGRTAIAVRNQNGFSQLVRVDLTTGAAEALTEPSLEIVYSHPRIHPDGKRAVFAAHRGDRWRLAVLDLASRNESIIPFEEEGHLAMPEWSRDASGSVLAVLLRRGFVDLHRIRLDGTSEPLTRSSSAAFSPAPASDGRLFFMGLERDGWVVRMLDRVEALPLRAEIAGDLVPALPPAAPPRREFDEQPADGGRAYGVGKHDLLWLGGGTYARGLSATEVGLRTGDIVGRLEAMLVGSFGSGAAQEGIGLAAEWRGWPVRVRAHGYAADEKETRVGARRRGLLLATEWDRTLPTLDVAIEGGVHRGTANDRSRGGAYVDLSSTSRLHRGPWTIRYAIDVSGELGETDGRRWSNAAASLRTSAKIGGTEAAIIASHARGSASTEVFDALSVGGLPSSIIPDRAMARRFADPALDPGTLVGRRYNGIRLELTTALLPARFFYQRHQLGQSLELAGVEASMGQRSDPITRFPGFDVRAGYAYLLEAPVPSKHRLWIGLRWRL